MLTFVSKGANRPARVTSSDVARLSGVSRATVSYVLNRKPNQTIPEETRKRVLAAASKLNYIPSNVAVSLKRGYSRVILIVKDVTMSGRVTEPFTDSIIAHLKTKGFVALTLNYNGPASLSSIAQELQPFGVIALATISEETTEHLRSAGVQHIYRSVASPSGSEDPMDRPWEAEIGRMQARVLIEAGAKAISYGIPPDEAPRQLLAHSRCAGAREYAESQGIPFVGPLKLSDSPDHAIAALERAWSTALSPAAPSKIGFAGFDDTIGAIALSVATKLGFNVPGELVVIAADNEPFSAFLAPPLSTIAVDSRASGRSVAERFIALTESQDLTNEPTAKATLSVVYRESTGLRI